MPADNLATVVYASLGAFIPVFLFVSLLGGVLSAFVAWLLGEDE